jgi:hypothetical protein
MGQEIRYVDFSKNQKDFNYKVLKSKTVILLYVSDHCTLASLFKICTAVPFIVHLQTRHVS